MSELIKDIKDYEGLYQITSTGRVLSLAKSDGNGNRNRYLKFDISTNNHTNYARVTLSKNGKLKRFLVHRLVATTFIANPDNKPHVNHIDNDGLNNNLENLEWCTAKENMQHSCKQARQVISQIRATEAAVIKNYQRYINVWKEKLGKRFIAYYAPHEINQRGKKATTGIAYYCSKCNIERLSATSWAELTKHNGTCPNCYTTQLNLIE